MSDKTSHRRRSSSLEKDSEGKKDGVGGGGGNGAAKRPRPVSLVRTHSVIVDSQLAGQIFDHFCTASTFKSILRSYRYLCEILRLKPNQISYFYPKLKANLMSWKAQALWTKLDKRASQKCYNRGKACAGTRVLVIGAGPCGLRTAIEAQLLGAKVVIVEKRDRFSRNNVLHLWPYNIHELRAIGAKKFYGKFCAGAIDHISIRQLQFILLKVCLLLGVEVFEGVGFEELIEPTDAEVGWKARVSPPDHPLSQYEFDVLVGADGKRNTLAGFKRKEFRGKLAIAITANFLNKYTEAEGMVEEISGVAFIFNQKFFNDLNQALGIDLENIVYYKDETHYFVMTAKKQSLLAKGVLLENLSDPAALLNPSNISQEALFQYAREAADFATKGQLPHLDFAVNHYGKPDVAMFDFTSMYGADHSARVLERHGHRLLQCLVGDSLLEPFWPTGTGCPRGFFSAMDAMWLMKQMESGKMSVLECLAERESIYRILSQTTPENTCKNYSQSGLDPATRYPTVNLKLVLPFQITHLYDTDNPSHLQPQNVLQDSAPRKKRRKESQVNPGTLLTWIQKQVAPYDLEVKDMSTSFQNGLVLCAIIHRYRPDLLNWDTLEPGDIVQNNQLAFDILESELGLQPVTTGQEIANNVAVGRSMDKLAVISYLTGVYELFRREIPHTQVDPTGQIDDLDDSVYFHNHIAKAEHQEDRRRRQVAHRQAQEQQAAGQLNDGVTIGQLVADEALRRKRPTNQDGNQEAEAVDLEVSGTKAEWGNTKGRKVSNKKRLAKLMERAALQKSPLENKERLPPMSIKNEENFKKIREILAGERKREQDKQKDKKPNDLRRAIGRIDSADWNLKLIEEKIRDASKAKSNDGSAKREKVPKWSKEAFNDKLKKVKCTLEQRDPPVKQHSETDRSLIELQRKSIEAGEAADKKGSNRVSTIVGELASRLVQQPASAEPPELKREPSNVWQPPKQKSSRSSENCHFCQEKVYVVERMSAEGKFFHRACFRCDYCNILLRLGSYVYHREGRFGGKFFCIPHSTETALEKYKYKKKTDEIQAKAQVSKDNKMLNAPTKDKWSKKLQNTAAFRGTTPERAEYEATEDEKERLEVMDEDEWTDLNFGNSTNCANTSDDSISDLDSDVEVEGEDLIAKSLSANETRKLAEEYRASQGFRNEGLDVRYTDQEYEDSSDGEHPGVGNSRVHRTRRRNIQPCRALSSDCDNSSDEDNYSDTTEDSDDSDSDSDDETPTDLDDAACDEEIRQIERRDNNPFNYQLAMSIPRIVVEPNSPVAGMRSLGALRGQRMAAGAGAGHQPPPDVVAGLATESIASKYQYKTPDYTKYQPKGPEYRTLSGVLSNNLKKNWVAPAPANQAQQGQRKVDQSEIDAKLKSLMDRLSSQQSLLKPAEKPSPQMQHYLDQSVRNSQDRTVPTQGALSLPAYASKSVVSPTTPIVSPVGISEKNAAAPPPVPPLPTSYQAPPSVPPVVPPPPSSLQTEVPDLIQHEAPAVSVKPDDLPQDAPSEIKEAESKEFDDKTSTGFAALAIPDDIEDIDTGATDSGDTTESTESDEDSEDSLTDLGEAEQVESKFEEVPEIKINLAEAEDLDDEDEDHTDLELSPRKSHPTGVADKGENQVSGDGNEHPGSLSPLDQDELLACDKTPVPDEEAVAIDDPVAADEPKEKEGGQNHEECIDVQPTDVESIDIAGTSAVVRDPTDCDNSSNSNMIINSGEDQSKVREDAGAAVDEAAAAAAGEESRPRNPPIRRPSLLKTVVSIKSSEPVTVVNYEIVDQTNVASELATSEDNTDPPNELIAEAINSNLVQARDDEGNLVVTESNRDGDNGEENFNYQDIYQVKNANERRAKLNLYQQKQSNIVHDLIMGIPRQRRARLPRATIPTSSIPPPPSQQDDASIKNGKSGISAMLDDFQMIDDDEDSISQKLDNQQKVKRDTMSPLVGGSSPVARGQTAAEGAGCPRQSAPVNLPPTPITNPEKFGIRPNSAAKKSENLASPTESLSSSNTDNLDGIVSPESSSSGPSSPKKDTNANSASPIKKGRGLLSAVTSIFRSPSTPSSPSPITSPDSSKATSAPHVTAVGHPSKHQVSSSKKTIVSLSPATSTPTSKHAQKAEPTSPVDRLAEAMGEQLNVDGGKPRRGSDGTNTHLSLSFMDESSDMLDIDDDKEDSLASLDLLHLANLGLPSNLVERLEKRFSKRGQRLANKAAMARIRRVQEIQRELQVIEVDCAEVEKDGVVLEKRLREDPDQGQLMSDWYRLLGEKNKLVRREQELMVESKQLELADMADREECALARAGVKSGSSLRPGEVGELLENLARIAEQREQLQVMLDKDRERYRREDKEIMERMEQQGIRLQP